MDKFNYYPRSSTASRGTAEDLFFDGFIFIHLPPGFSTQRSFPTVVNHGFLHSDHFVMRRINITRRSCSFPVSGGSGSISPPSSSLSFVHWYEKEPLFLVLSAQLSRIIWNISQKNFRKMQKHEQQTTNTCTHTHTDLVVAMVRVRKCPRQG